MSNPRPDPRTISGPKPNLSSESIFEGPRPKPPQPEPAR
jgi:hypothetical protein